VPRGFVQGLLYDLDPAGIAVLELLLGGGGRVRMEVEVNASLRLVRALAWGVPDEEQARRLGGRPPLRRAA
jgi:hypothetical protein